MIPAFALGLLLAASSGAKADDPVAVLPFKNLNQDPSYDWLKLGMAETMVADLRRSGKVRVVERDQLDKAMAEVALQSEKGTDESTAVRVGKMVGARTILVGSFQQFSGQVRIVARFVSAETGVVGEAVKLTGPMQKILALQDQVVARLLGEEPPKPTRSARRSEPKVVKAYQLYAMSLGTASDAERVGYLKRALEIDPDFAYAADDLLALEKRLRGYSEKSQQRRVERGEAEAEALFSGKGTPEERARRVHQLFAEHLQGYRYRALLRDAQRVLELELPATEWFDASEYASFCIFLAYQQLKEPDKALQAGEKHLLRFPAGRYELSIQPTMRVLIDQRLEREKGPELARARLQEIEQERAGILAQKHPPSPIRLSGLDLKRCVELMSAWQYREAATECRGFVEKHRTLAETEPLVRDQALAARLQEIRAHIELGEFDRARALADELTAVAPDYARQVSVSMMTSVLPRD
jgi:TolB-like protein